jgi:hypothetical protein
MREHLALAFGPQGQAGKMKFEVATGCAAIRLAAV